MFFVVTTQSFAFYIGQADGIGQQLFNAILTFSTYPTGIFSGWGRLVLFTVIPAGFISYLPIGLLREADLTFTLQALGMTGLVAAAGLWFFHRGLRRYSSGNAMGLRM
nr:ABC-2 family transporter protein [Paenibacillus elgii]